ANTAIFTVVDSVLLKPLAYDDPDRLMMVWSTNPAARHDHDPVAPLDVMDFRGAASFSSLQATVGFVATTAWISGSGSADRITVTAVTPGLFDMLGRRPDLGRLFTEKEDPNAIVISNAFWRTRLGSDPNVVGRVLNIQGQPSIVIGVMPAGFVFPYRAMLAPGGPPTIAAHGGGPPPFAPPPRVPGPDTPHVTSAPRA